MAVRIRYSTKVQVSSDPTTESKDLGNLNYEVVSDGLGEGGARKFTLAAAASDEPLNMGNVAAASFLFIKTNAKNDLDTPVEITVKRNTVGNEAIPITPLTTTKQGHFLLSTSGLTALFASNPGAVDMELTVAVAGD
jgi:CO dehydrogenase/acetyl-CoA synthase gamma subunit (corrinoid Fe-S protein)